MKLRVLGCSGAEFPGFHPPGFLIDDTLLMDAGTIGSVLNENEQWKIRNIIITHAHLDHIRGIPFLADNIIIKQKNHSVTVLSIPSVIKTIMQNLLNDKVWPDFTVIPDAENAVIKIKTIKPNAPFQINSYNIIAYPVNHSVPATGYVIEDKKGKRLLYTGDTGPTEAIWKATKDKIDFAIIEVSMPNAMRNMAIMTGHLTAQLLSEEIGKMTILPERILITHPKPQYLRLIKKEVKELKLKNLSILKDGDIFDI